MPNGLRGFLADTRPLRQPAFRRLWIANIVTVIGAQLTVVAVPAQIYALTNSSAWVGLTGLFGLVPLIVFGLWGGALADHFDRRTLLIITTAGLIGTSALFCVLALQQHTDVWLLLIVYAVQQACFAVNQHTRTAVLPALLPLDTPQGRVRALVLTANTVHPQYRGGLSLEDTAAIIASACGSVGSNRAYLDQLNEQLDLLGIEDEHVRALSAAVERRPQADG